MTLRSSVVALTALGVVLTTTAFETSACDQQTSSDPPGSAVVTRISCLGDECTVYVTFPVTSSDGSTRQVNDKVDMPRERADLCAAGQPYLRCKPE